MCLTARLTTEVSICATRTPSDMVSRTSTGDCAIRGRARARTLDTRRLQIVVMRVHMSNVRAYDKFGWFGRDRTVAGIHLPSQNVCQRQGTRPSGANFEAPSAHRPNALVGAARFELATP